MISKKCDRSASNFAETSFSVQSKQKYFYLFPNTDNLLIQAPLQINLWKNELGTTYFALPLQINLRKNELRTTYFSFNPLSANPTKWSNTLKQFVGNLPTNCLSVLDHLVGLAFKGPSDGKEMEFGLGRTVTATRAHSCTFTYNHKQYFKTCILLNVYLSLQGLPVEEIQISDISIGVFSTILL